MKTILLATDRKFWRKEQGSAQRISALYQYLRDQGFTVFVFLIGKINENDFKVIQRDHPNFKIFTWRYGYLSTERHLSFQILKLFMLSRAFVKQSVKLLKNSSGTPPTAKANSNKEVTLANFYNEQYLSYFRRVCSELQPDCIIVEYLRLAYLVQNLEDSIPNRPLTLVDTHDVMHQRYQRFQENGTNSELTITREEEAEQLNWFDVVIAIQDKDRDILAEMVPNRRVIEVGYTTPVTTHPTREQASVNITYVAGPNVANKHGITHFVENVWSQLYAKFKDKIELNIVGRVCETLENFNLANNVKLVGWAENLALVYNEADIIINPVYFGSGLKIKNVEALCHGKPLVTTTVGAEGLEHGKDKAFVVCDRIECTYNKLSELIEQPHLRKNLGQKAYTFAQTNFTDQKVYQELYDVLTTYTGN